MRTEVVKAVGDFAQVPLPDLPLPVSVPLFPTLDLLIWYEDGNIRFIRNVGSVTSLKIPILNGIFIFTAEGGKMIGETQDTKGAHRRVSR
jgi:hypothetical protein